MKYRDTRWRYGLVGVQDRHSLTVALFKSPLREDDSNPQYRQNSGHDRYDLEETFANARFRTTIASQT